MRQRCCRPTSRCSAFLKCDRGLTRAILAWACLLAFSLASQGMLPSAEGLARLGFSLPANERFPCEGCACGCVNADQCWTSCCCHTLGERIDWAQSRGVTIPRSIASRSFQLLEARDRARVEAANLPACCKNKLVDAACAGACVDACCAHGEPAPRVAMLSALHCKGVPGWLMLGSPPIAQAFAARALLALPRDFCRVSMRDMTSESRAIAYPSPPPRA